MLPVYKRGIEDYVLDFVVYAIMILVVLATVYPFWYALVISFNDGVDATRGGIYIWPRMFTLENYQAVFSMDQIFTGFVVSIARTIIGTALSLAFTALFAYAISHGDLMFRKTYMMIMIISMYFSGGLIPYFLLLRQLGLMNSFWVYIIPSLLSVWNAIIMVAFFREIPQALKEAAKIDGANDLYIFVKIIVPVSTPVLATMALFIGVFHWNAWFDAAFFVSDRSLRTLQFWLVEIINQANIQAITGGGDDMARELLGAAQGFTAETIRMATMIIVVVPIICIYPFLQRYFVKGIMIGSLKE